jgi:hypothetical protein
MALSAIATRTANAVHIGLRHIGQVVVKDVGYRLDINATGGHIGGHQYMDTPGPKGSKGAITLALILVTVNGLRIDPLGAKRFL